MKSKDLECGFRVIPYIVNGEINEELSEEDFKMCDQTFRSLQLERRRDRLSYNYAYGNINFGSMLFYNVVYDVENDKPVFISGTQILNDECVRVFSRYFVFPKYRTDGNKLLDKIDDFQELEYVLDSIPDEYKLVVWTRDKSPTFFKKLKDGRPDVFSDWEVYDSSIKLMWENNDQFIFYRGIKNNIQKLEYEFYQNPQ